MTTTARTEVTTNSSNSTFPPLAGEINHISEKILDSAFYLHRLYGPGLLESAYEKLLSYELHIKHKFKVEAQKLLPLRHEGLVIDAGYRLDLLVEDSVIIEVKAIERLLPIHEAQLLTYMKLSGIRLGLLLNFNEKLIRNGIKRMIL